MKQVRILLMLKQAYRELYQLIHPHAVTTLKLDGKVLTKEVLGGIMSNVGPALGEAGPAENYSTLPTLGKWILSFCMLIGRLEVYTVLILFVPRFWEK